MKVGEWTQYEMFSDPMVARVAKFEKADETIPLCLIGLKEELPRGRTSSASTSGSAWRLVGRPTQMFTADAFKRDAEAKTFTLLRADNSRNSPTRWCGTRN